MMHLARADKEGRDLPRVALVTNVLAHYRVPCFQRLVAQMPGRLDIYLLAGEMEHRHYVMAQSQGDLPVTILPGRRFRRPPDDDIHWNSLRPIFRQRYDVVILGGWAEPTYLHLWLRLLFSRRRLLFWVESTTVDYQRSTLKETFKRLLLKASSGCLVPGQRAGEYCRRLGVPEERIFTALNATDRSFFQQRAELHLPRREDLRRELDLEKPTFLFVGRLVEAKKGISTLLRAVAQLAARGVQSSLLLAGEGPDRQASESLANELALKDVRFLGNLDHEELCRYYAAADALVLPSLSEPWGFVLNEAMEFGRPLVVSDAVGAGPDLVRGNGFVHPAGDVDALAEALEHLATDPEQRKTMGRISRTLVEEFSPENWAQGVLKAVRSV